VPPRDRLPTNDQSATLHAGFGAQRHPSGPFASRSRVDNLRPQRPPAAADGEGDEVVSSRHLKRPPAGPDSP
jgi:hypothetical protein